MIRLAFRHLTPPSAYAPILGAHLFRARPNTGQRPGRCPVLR